MLLESPLINYNSIKINGIEIELETTCKASFSSPFNKIDFEMTPTNCSLSHFEVRVTGVDDAYDIGVGNLAYWSTSIPLNKIHKFSINITPDIFDAGDGTYRISLYAKSSIDGSWDVTYFVFTINNEQILLADGTPLGVLTTREAPKN